MKTIRHIILNIVGSLCLAGILIYAVWQPVIPSGFIIDKMAEAIDPDSLPPDHQQVVRFVLDGKGGGIYSLQAEKGNVSVIDGKTENVDLIIYMKATDFNSLMFSLAQGKADMYTFNRLIISKHLRFAGDMDVLEKIFTEKGDS